MFEAAASDYIDSGGQVTLGLMTPGREMNSVTYVTSWMDQKQ